MIRAILVGTIVGIIVMITSGCAALPALGGLFGGRGFELTIKGVDNSRTTTITNERDSRNTNTTRR